MPSNQELNTFNEELRTSPLWQNFMTSRGINPARVGLSDVQRRELQRELEGAGVQFPRGVEIDRAGNLNENEGFSKHARTVGRIGAIAAPIIAAPFTGGASLALIGAGSGAANAALSGGGLRDILLGTGLGSLAGVGGGAPRAAGTSVGGAMRNALLNPRALATLAAPAVPDRYAQALTLAAPFLSRSPLYAPGGGRTPAPNTFGAPSVRATPPSAYGVSSGPRETGLLPSRGPTHAMINAGRNLPSVASTPSWAYGTAPATLPSRGPTRDMINAGRNLPSADVWRNPGASTPIPSYGPTQDIINAGRNLPFVNSNRPSDYLGNRPDTTNDQRENEGGARNVDWEKVFRYLSGLSSIYAVNRNSRPNPEDQAIQRQIQQMLAEQQRRTTLQNPLVEAVTRLAMSRLPTSVQLPVQGFDALQPTAIPR